MNDLYDQFIENNKISNISFSEKSLTIPERYEKLRMHHIHFGLITLFTTHAPDYLDVIDAIAISFKYKSCTYYIQCESDGIYLYFNAFYKTEALTLIDKLTRYYESEYAESQKYKKEWLSEKRSCSIRNYYWQEMQGLMYLGKKIEQEYKEYSEYGFGDIPQILLQQTQGQIDGDYVKYIPAQFEIECYIRTTFSLIEHMATLLLPLFEYTNGQEWHYLKEHAKGEFIPDSWATFILQKDNNDKFIKIFFEMVNHFDRSLADYYWSLKIDLRNVIEHGFVSGPRLDNIEFYSPSLKEESIMNALSSTENYFVEMDYLAYKNCQNLLQQFHDWIERRNPVFMRILEVANFIPSDPAELLEFADGNPDRVNDFYSQINLRIFDLNERITFEYS